MMRTVEKEHDDLVIKIDKDKAIRKNLVKELSIDGKEITLELLRQPSKYAWWATMVDLAKIDLEISFKGMISSEDADFHESIERYQHAKRQLSMLEFIKSTLVDRKNVLLELASHPKNKLLIDRFNKKVRKISGELGLESRSSQEESGGHTNVRIKHFKVSRAISSTKQWR